MDLLWSILDGWGDFRLQSGGFWEFVVLHLLIVSILVLIVWGLVEFRKKKELLLAFGVDRLRFRGILLTASVVLLVLIGFSGFYPHRYPLRVDASKDTKEVFAKIADTLGYPKDAFDSSKSIPPRFFWTWETALDAIKESEEFKSRDVTLGISEPEVGNRPGPMETAFLRISDPSSESLPSEVVLPVWTPRNSDASYGSLIKVADESRQYFLGRLANDLEYMCKRSRSDDSLFLDFPLRSPPDDLPLKALFLLDLKTLLYDEDPFGGLEKSNDDQEEFRRRLKIVLDYKEDMDVCEEVDRVFEMIGTWRSKPTAPASIPSSSDYPMSYLRWYDFLLREANAPSTFPGIEFDFSPVENSGNKALVLPDVFQHARTKMLSSQFDGSVAAYPLYCALVAFGGKDELGTAEPVPLTFTAFDTTPELTVNVPPIVDSIESVCQDMLRLFPSKLKDGEFVTSRGFAYLDDRTETSGLVGTKALYFTTKALVRYYILKRGNQEDAASEGTVRYLISAKNTLDKILEAASDVENRSSYLSDHFSDGYSYCYVLRAQLMLARLFSVAGLPSQAAKCLKDAITLSESLAHLYEGPSSGAERRLSSYYRLIAHAAAVRQLTEAHHNRQFVSPEESGSISPEESEVISKIRQCLRGK